MATGYVASLQHNFPSLYGVSSWCGYDPLIEEEGRYQVLTGEFGADPLAALRHYGVTHLIVHRDVDLAEKTMIVGRGSPCPVSWGYLPVADHYARKRPAAETESVRVYEVEGASPLAFTEGRPERALPVRVLPCAVSVSAEGLREGDTLVINYLYRPGVRVTADGAVLSAEADDLGRIRVRPPAGAREIRVDYEAPWTQGLAFGAMLVLSGIVAFLVLRRRAGRTRPTGGSGVRHEAPAPVGSAV
jgi:hypothetical protein